MSDQTESSASAGSCDKQIPRCDDFIRLLLQWNQPLPGRGLPWVSQSDPYIVWVSEIMLQQTRAETVIPYFERFMRELPNLQSLAAASNDQVMKLWSGLGYYTRARNLHACAKIICSDHHGIFPQKFEEILSLPGIGRSTAGAICALAFAMRTPILDGNAKRVYSRHFAIDDEPLSKRNRILWQIADAHTPANNTQKYTQRIMDLGATVCLPKNPKCTACPLAGSCAAKALAQVERFPIKVPSKHRPTVSVTMIVAFDQSGNFLVQKRPDSGIWGGLWSFPEFTGNTDTLTNWMREHYGADVQLAQPGAVFHHHFTHYRLAIVPQPVSILALANRFHRRSDVKLIHSDSRSDWGIPAPVITLINRYSHHSFEH